MLPDIQPGNTKILYFFNCLLDGMHTILTLIVSYIEERNFAGKARDMVIEIRYILL